MSSNYVCQNCSKTYKRHSYFLKHQLECRCMDNLLREPISIETLKIPSTIQQTLEFLITSNRELKEQLKKMHNEKSNEKRKIGIIPWLSKNYKPESNFNDSINNITLSYNYLLMLIDNNISIVLKEILIDKFKDKEYIKSFDIKSNKVYIFDINNEWLCLTSDTCKLLISKINKELLNLLIIWQTEQGDKIYFDNISTIYLKILKKINKINLHNTTIITQINQQLYEVAKTNLQLIEYEIF